MIKGAPRFNRQIAQELADLGVPSFACTPQVFPDLMAAVLDRRDLQLWAASRVLSLRLTISHFDLISLARVYYSNSAESNPTNSAPCAVPIAP